MTRSSTAAQARAWLPPAAIQALDMDGKLAAIVRAWSTKWFARETVRPLETLSAKGSQDATGTGWIALDTDIAVRLTDIGKTALPGLMLNLDLPEVRTAADDRVLAEMLQWCLDDVCTRLAEAFRLDAGKRWTRFADGVPCPLEDARECPLGIDTHTPLLRFAVANDTLIDLAKAGLPRPAKPGRLAPLSQALGAQDIAVSAHVGQCSLTLADFAGLGVGDVLVFHREIDAPLDLLVDAQGPAVGKCHIVQAEGRLDLTLLESISG